MTAAMEAIVRPFAPVVITPPALAPSIAAVTNDPIAFSLGGKGGRTISFSFDKFKVVIEKNKDDLKESGRESTKVRVENENDPEQFVEFCRADKIHMSPKKKGAPDPSSSHASSDSSAGPQGGAQKETPQEFSYQYPSDKTCKPKSDPPKGCK